MQGDTQSTAVNKAVAFALIFFIISWVLTESFNNLAIILCGLLWIILKGFKKVSLKNFFVLWSVLFSLAFFISILYSDNKAEAFNLAQRKLLLPVVLLIFPFLLSKVERAILLRVYIISWILLSIYSLSYTFLIHGIDYNNISYFSWLIPQSTQLASTYLGLFVSFALIILLGDVKENSIFHNKIVTLSFALYFILYLILLSARTPLFAALIVIIFFPLFSRARNKMVISIYVVMVIASTAALTIMSPFLYEKMERLMNRNDPRFFEFQAGIKIVDENFLTGVGVGDIQNHLEAAYQQSGFQQGIKEKLNVHNEFLHDTMAVGVFGLVLVISVAGVCLWRVVQTRDFLQFGFTVLFFLCCMTEVMLNRQKGITFFAFFICLLYVVPIDEKNTSR